MDVIPKYEFLKIVDRYNGNHRLLRFTCWDQFFCLCFGQLTFRDSLRDIVTTLDALGSRYYQMGIKTIVTRNVFSRANANEPWQIELFFKWMKHLWNQTANLETNWGSSTFNRTLVL